MKDYVEVLLIFFAVIFSLLAIGLMFWKLVGNSPTIEEITLGLMAMTASWLVTLSYKFGKMEGKTELIDLNMRTSFDRVKDDLQELKLQLKEIRQRLK
ncbi:hypothetical protein HYX14_02690 [Candidatus Woesearchaeota archaeon]|nr:hypothetical protein [Candidatus Woesearchaeota archaeon]